MSWFLTEFVTKVLKFRGYSAVNKIWNGSASSKMERAIIIIKITKVFEEHKKKYIEEMIKRFKIRKSNKNVKFIGFEEIRVKIFIGNKFLKRRANGK